MSQKIIQLMELSRTRMTSDEEDDIEFVFEQTETENCFYVTKYAAEE